MENKLPPVHPGEHIKQGLKALSLSNAHAAEILGCTRAFVGALIKGKKHLSVEMCIKIAALLGSTPDFWARLQYDYDIKVAEKDRGLRSDVSKIKSSAKELRAVA